MKLIYCPVCSDIRRLRNTLIICDCGASSGKYIDNVNAEIYGDAIPIGIDNKLFVSAINNRSFYKDISIVFAAWVISHDSKSIKDHL